MTRTLFALPPNARMMCCGLSPQRKRKCENDRTQKEDRKGRGRKRVINCKTCSHCSTNGNGSRQACEAIGNLHMISFQRQFSQVHEFCAMAFWCVRDFFSLPSFPFSLIQSDLISECMHVRGFQWTSRPSLTLVCMTLPKTDGLNVCGKSYSFTQSKPSACVDIGQPTPYEWIDIFIIGWKNCEYWLKLWRIFDGF